MIWISHICILSTIVKINKNLGHHSTALHMDIVYIILNIYTKLCLLLSLFSKYVATFIAQPTLLGIDNRSDNSNSSRTRKRENKISKKKWKVLSCVIKSSLFRWSSFSLIIYFPLQDTAAKSSAKLKTKLKGLYAGRTPRSRTAFSSTVIKSWVVQENWGLKIS